MAVHFVRWPSQIEVHRAPFAHLEFYFALAQLFVDVRQRSGSAHGRRCQTEAQHRETQDQTVKDVVRDVLLFDEFDYEICKG